VALNCTVPPGAVKGLPTVCTLIELSVADETVIADGALVWPNVALPAVMFAVPAETPVTTPFVPPALLTVATPVASEAQVTWVVRVWVLPSLKFPTAENPSIAPV